ncbi:Phosphoribosylformylglycinamidine synthase subunit PurS [Nocardiopsis gilva]
MPYAFPGPSRSVERRPPEPVKCGTTVEDPVARVIVDVMLKPEILDPQGQAIVGACGRLGFDGVTQVRQGKRFEVEVEGEVDDAKLADIRRLAETLLANPVIEDFELRVA